MADLIMRAFADPDAQAVADLLTAADPDLVWSAAGIRDIVGYLDDP